MKPTLTSSAKKEGSQGRHARLSWLPELANVDPMTSLTLSIKHITALLNDTALTVAEKVSFICTIDEANHAAASEQIVTFAKADHLKADIADSMVGANYAYHRIVFLSYVKLIGLTSHKPTDQQAETVTQLYLFTRALCSAHDMLKWRYFERAAAPANLWSQACALYMQAEQQALTKQPIQPYPNSAETTVNHLFLQLFMLGSLNYNQLVKPQLHVIDQLLGHWMAEVRVKNKLESFHLFYIDLTKDQPAKRIRNGLLGPSCLYWDLDEIEYAIDQSLAQIAQHEAPALLDKVDIQNTPLLALALNTLKQAWSRTDYSRQRRKEIREDAAKTASVTMGLAPIHLMLHQFNQLASPAQPDEQPFTTHKTPAMRIVMRGSVSTLVMGKEKWHIVNQSTNGLGSVIQEKTNADTQPKRLVAILTQHEHKKPMLGVVRNIKQMSAGKLKIGLEILTTDPLPVSLQPYDLQPAQPLNTDTDTPTFCGLYIPHDILAGRAASLIIPKQHYLAQAYYALQVKHKQLVIQLGAQIEDGDDWVNLNFSEQTF
ncbi:MAG TPA: hypothetical protein VGD04_02315 [Methylophilus sp.]